MSSTKRVEHPLDVVSVGDIVDVRVIDVDIPKARISLSMILDEKEAANRKYTKDNSNNKNNRNNGKGNRRDRKPKKRSALTFQVLPSSCINRSIVWKIELNSTA